MTETKAEQEPDPNAGKLAMVEAKRQTLDNERYAAELDLKLAKKSKHDELEAEPQERLDEIDAKLKVLDDEEAKLK